MPSQGNRAIIVGDRFADIEKNSSSLVGRHSVTVVPLTSDRPRQEVFRVRLEPSEENGLRQRSHVMIDKIATLPRAKTGTFIGRVSNEDMALVDRALAVFLGFA